MIRKIFTLLIAIMSVSCIYTSYIFADTMDAYKNGSTSSYVTNNKIINYFNTIPVDLGNSNAFCTGRDEITYNESFFDIERDYMGLSFADRLKSNSSLTEQQKKVNTVNLKAKYVHTPGIYDNPVSVSPLSGFYFPVTVNYNTSTGKWEIVNSTSTALFNHPTDDKRGQWTIYLEGSDDTTKTAFNKISIGSSTFRVHKAPVPKMSFSENSTTATLTDKGSYDVDYQYSKNTRKNATGDRQFNGIKEFYWSVKLGNTWVDAGVGPTVTINKSGQTVTDYMLTVEDYDGAKTSISKSSPILQKPDVDFSFLAGTNFTTYFYNGNAGNESVSVSPMISWNDEAYDSGLYTSSGTRTQTWTATVNTKFANDVATFQTDVLKKYYSTCIKDNKLPVELEAKNMYDLFATKLRSADIIPITTVNKTGSEGTVSCSDCENAVHVKPFMVGTKAPLILNLTNSKVNNDDLKVLLTASDVGINNVEVPISNNQVRYNVALQNPNSYSKAWWDNFSYTYKIYSKRTNELLNTDSGNIYIHTPITVDGYVNDSKDNVEVNYDGNIKLTAVTPKYTKTVTVKLPFKAVVDGTVTPTNTAIYLTPNASHTSWNKTITLSEDIGSDTAFNALFEAIAYNNRDKATDTVSGTVIAYKLTNFRVTMVRDLRLANYYKSGNNYADKEMDVNKMAIDPSSFYPFPIDYLTKGYEFEFKIDSKNFNDTADKIVITPSFYSVTDKYRDPNEKKAYWIDSDKHVINIGEGGNSNYKTIVLTKDNRHITDSNNAIWSGKYIIPGTTFLTNQGTDTTNALSNKINSDIIVNFNIVGYKGNEPKFNYNVQQWPKERTTDKIPYDIGDVIRYSDKSNLDDFRIIRNRP